MNREIILIVIGKIVMIGALVAYGYAATDIKRLEAESIALEEERSMLLAAAEQSVAARSALEQLALDETFVDARFARTDDIVSFLGYLEKEGGIRGAYVDVVSVSDKPVNGALSVALRITGSFTAIMETLDALEYGAYVITAKSVNVSQDPEGNWELTATLDALAKTP